MKHLVGRGNIESLNDYILISQDEPFVEHFTKQENGKSKAVFYGISIMLIFGLMGLITMAFGAPFLNFLRTHWLPNLIFFVIKSSLTLKTHLIQDLILN